MNSNSQRGRAEAGGSPLGREGRALTLALPGPLGASCLGVVGALQAQGRSVGGAAAGRLAPAGAGRPGVRRRPRGRLGTGCQTAPECQTLTALAARGVWEGIS